MYLTKGEAKRDGEIKTSDGGEYFIESIERW